MKAYTQCANYASNTCPCELAEMGHCIVCSMCRGEKFCSCSDTVSFCVMQELAQNNGHAKKANSPIKCEVVTAKEYGGCFKCIQVKLPGDYAEQFRELGAFAFLRIRENDYFDCPISVAYEAEDTNTLMFIIHYNGIKTAGFRTISAGDSIFVRGPYFNAIQGKRQIAALRNSKATVITRGMGLVPSLSVIASLKKQDNEVEVYFDQGILSSELSDFLFEKHQVVPKTIRLLDGKLTTELKALLDRCCEDDTELIHLGMSDYPLRRIVDYIRVEHGGAQILSCDNNARMCCGEGICGACAKRTVEGKVIHLCKEQVDVYEFGKLI